LSPIRVGSPPGSSFQSIFSPALRALWVERSSSAPQISASSVSPLAIFRESIDEILGRVAAGVRVDELPWRRVQPVGDSLGRVAAAAERRGEARADVGEEFENRHRIDPATQRRRADRGAAIVESEVRGLGTEGDIRAFA